MGGMDWIAHVAGALFSTYRGASKLPDEMLMVIPRANSGGC
jgi:hypothetical protein